MLHWTRISAVTVCVAGCISQAYAGRTDDLYIRYFKERRALSLDTTRVAVFDDGGGRLADSVGAPVLVAAGLNADGGQKSVIKGWTLVPSEAGRSTAAKIDEMVSAVAASVTVMVTTSLLTSLLKVVTMVTTRSQKHLQHKNSLKSSF